MQQRLSGVDLSGVRHDHFHHAFAGEHLEHQLHVADGGIVDAGEFQEQGLPRCRFLLGLGFRNAALHRGQGVNGVAHDLGGLFVPDGQPPLYHHCLIFLHVSTAGLQHPAEAQQFQGGGVVLHHDIGHKAVVLGGFRLAGGDDAGNGDPLAVGEALRTVFPGKVLDN